jgi:hypothetical protein
VYHFTVACPSVDDLEGLGLPSRVVRILNANGIERSPELIALNERELLALPGFGPGALGTVRQALAAAGVALSVDPYGSYVCARHGDPAWDTSLANLFLCDDCADLWRAEAFADAAPEYVGQTVDGYCLNCNLRRPDCRLRQWLLCGTCERVARSIGRSVVAERFVAERWRESVEPHAADLELLSTDVPTLRRRDRDTTAAKRSEIDFAARDRNTGEVAFGFELKTGKSHISGIAQVGARMGQFQLDTSDCEDITTVIELEGIPVYLLHVQVIDRAFPPTLQYVALGAWWTDVFRMNEHFRHVQRRPRETRDAAYFDTAMFEDFHTFGAHVTSGAAERLAERLRDEDIPTLYRR